MRTFLSAAVLLVVSSLAYADDAIFDVLDRSQEADIIKLSSDDRPTFVRLNNMLLECRDAIREVNRAATQVNKLNQLLKISQDREEEGYDNEDVIQERLEEGITEWEGKLATAERTWNRQRNDCHLKTGQLSRLLDRLEGGGDYGTVSAVKMSSEGVLLTVEGGDDIRLTREQYFAAGGRSAFSPGQSVSEVRRLLRGL